MAKKYTWRLTMTTKYRPELKAILKDLVELGYSCYITREDSYFVYGFIITPNDNVLYIQRDTYAQRGWVITFKFVPSGEFGNACVALPEPFRNISVDTIAMAEKNGLAFAKNLGATLYKNSKELFTSIPHFEKQYIHLRKSRSAYN